jgi:hypothetical protein
MTQAHVALGFRHWGTPAPHHDKRKRLREWTGYTKGQTRRARERSALQGTPTHMYMHQPRQDQAGLDGQHSACKEAKRDKQARRA